MLIENIKPEEYGLYAEFEEDKSEGIPILERHVEIEFVENAPLKTYKITRTDWFTKRTNTRPYETVYGLIENRIFFRRKIFRPASISYDDDDNVTDIVVGKEDSVVWDLISEGPLQHIEYYPSWSLRRNYSRSKIDEEKMFMLGFANPLHPKFIRGGVYNGSGTFVSHFYVGASSYFLPTGTGGYIQTVRAAPLSPVLNIYKSPSLGVKEIKYNGCIILEGTHGDELVDKMILPAQVDLPKWKSILFDDKIIFDNSLPWKDWFEELGISLHLRNF